MVVVFVIFVGLVYLVLNSKVLDNMTLLQKDVQDMQKDLNQNQNKKDNSEKDLDKLKNDLSTAYNSQSSDGLKAFNVSA